MLVNFQSDREVMLGTLLALIHAHRNCQVVDREAVAQLDAKLKEERKRASELVGVGVVVILYEGQRHIYERTILYEENAAPKNMQLFTSSLSTMLECFCSCVGDWTRQGNMWIEC